MATQPQINYINNLAAKKDLTNASPELLAWINTPAALEIADNKQVDMLLTALKALPWLSTSNPPTNAPTETTTAQPPTPTNNPPNRSELEQLEADTRKGRYFITDPTDNVEKFFKVDKPEAPSRWAGKTFLHVQASDYFYPIKDPKHKIAVYKTIAEDPINAMNEYGIRLGVCGNCGRTLTAIDSRLRGMGPICAANILGAPTEEQLDLLDKLGLRKHNNED